MTHPSRGFTLIEMMVSLALLATLAVAALPLLATSARREQEMQLQRALREIRQGIDAYRQAVAEGRIEKRVDDSGYPPSLAALVDGVADRKDPNGARIYFMRRIPRDPMCDCPAREAIDTWRLRSYDSPPDAPRAGRDVFDVTSSSDAEGLNGIPYSAW